MRDSAENHKICRLFLPPRRNRLLGLGGAAGIQHTGLSLIDFA